MKSIIFFLVIVLCLFFNKDSYSQNNSKIKFGVSGFYEKSGASALVPEKQNVFNYGAQIDYRVGDSKNLIETGVVSLTRRFGFGDEVYNYFQVPMKYKREVSYLYFAVGGYADVFYSTKNYNGLKSRVNKEIKYGYLLNIGVHQNIYDKWNLFIVLETTNNLTGKEKFTNYGVGFGVNYILK